MSDYTHLADFSPEGLNIGKDAKVMTYLHGLSDFWVFMFDDASKINLMLEANAVTASDIYNKFLQLTSVISLEEISTLTNSQTKLILLSDKSNVGVSNPTTGKVVGKVETYYIPPDTPLKYARVLANRAFVPTTYLEAEADFYLDPETGQVSFARPLSELGFPFRLLADGTKEYAIWAIDAKVDDQVIYDYYAKLLDINPTTSSEAFKNFVYGMYYLYVNGPNLETMRRGLNIALGIPLARDVESVLEIRKYLNTDQWLVVTDLNSYLIPYGLEPSVAVDEVLTVGQELAEWIEVKDYISDGEWWINFMLPSHLMPHIPPSIPGGGGVNADAVPDRYMTEGSYADWVMRNYLKTHTFLVNVKTISFKNLQSFEQLAEVIRAVKPAYTAPIYVWTVPITDEIINVIETLTYEMDICRCEDATTDIQRFTRDSTNPILRDCCGTFTRMSASTANDDQLGYNTDINGYPRDFNGGIVTGYFAPQWGWRSLTTNEAALHRTFRTRGQEQYMPRRGVFEYRRDLSTAVDGTGVHPYASRYPGKRMVYLYTTTKADVKEKFATAGAGAVPSSYIFELFKPDNTIDMINEHAIDDSYEYTYYDFIIANFNYYFTPGTNAQNLGSLPLASYNKYLPPSSAVNNGDFLVFTEIYSGYYGVFWCTDNFDIETIPYHRHNTVDPITLRMSGVPNRGMAVHGSPFFALRGAGMTVSYNTSSAVNDEPINDAMDDSTSVTVTYGDQHNPNFNVDRSGVQLIVNRTWQ